jgi:hypothetical protein
VPPLETLPLFEPSVPDPATLPADAERENEEDDPELLGEWNKPQESEVDQQKYDAAVRDAQSLCLDSGWMVRKLHLIKIPDDVLQWAGGERASFSKGSRAVDMRAFRLGGDDA